MGWMGYVGWVQAVGSRLAHTHWTGVSGWALIFEFGLSIIYQKKRIDFVCSVRFSVFLYFIF